MKYDPAQIRKALVSGLALAATVATTLLGGHLIPEVAVPWVQAGLTIAGAYGVFAVRNAPADNGD